MLCEAYYCVHYCCTDLPVNQGIYILTCLIGYFSPPPPPPPLRQVQRCSRIPLYVSIFVGVTLIP